MSNVVYKDKCPKVVYKEKFNLYRKIWNYHKSKIIKIEEA